MARLIDANVLLYHLADYQLQESPNWGANGYGNADAYEAITNCIDAVEQMPTIDEIKMTMVGIVYCKDCICNGLCPIAEAGGFDDKGFCSRGERRIDAID